MPGRANTDVHAVFISRLLAKAPDERPRTGAELVRSIDAILEGLPD